VVRPWIIQSNFLVIVSVPDEDALLDLITEASRRGIIRTAVREPDLDNEATACALAPGDAARKLCANLPLALKLTEPRQPVGEMQVLREVLTDA